MTATDNALPEVKQDYLAEVVCRSRNNGRLQLGDWHVKSLQYSASNPISSGLYRVQGVERGECAPQGKGDPSAPWSLILKIVRSPAGRTTKGFPVGWGESPEHYSYWKREVLAYQSGLLADLPGRLAAPKCFGVEERAGNEYWLWLEDLGAVGRETWPLERYGVAAEHFGEFNGAYLAWRPLPCDDWLSTDWLRSWLAYIDRPLVQRTLQLAGDAATWKHPLVQRAFPNQVADRILRLGRERETLLVGLESLPRTLCHFDAQRPNLFARNGDSQTAAIDWAFVGSGAVGEEIGNLVAASLIFYHVPVSQARQLGEIVFDRYCEGLRLAGWNGDRRQVRFGYAAGAALRWGFFVADLLKLALDEKQRAKTQEKLGRPIEPLIIERAVFFSFLFDLADEAWSLLDVV